MSTIATNVKSTPDTLSERTRRRLHRFMHKVRKAQEAERAQAHLAKRASDFGPYSVRVGLPSETDALIGWLGLRLGTKPQPEKKGRG